MLDREKARRSSTLFLAAALLLVGLCVTHAHVIRQGPDYTGPLLVLDHLFDLVAVLVLIAICTGLGRFVFGLLRFELDEPLDDLLFATAIGAALISTVLLLVGLAGGFERWIIGAVMLLAALLSWRELGSVPQLATKALGSLKRRNSERALWLFGVIAFVSVVVMMLVLAVAPPVDWDSLMYHLRIPDQYLQAGRIHLPEDNLHASHIGLIHLLYMPLLAAGSIAGPAILNVILAASLGLAAYSLCMRLLDEKTAVLSLGLLWGTTMLFLVAISPRVDVSVAFYLFLAHYAVLLAFVRSPLRQPLLLLLAAALLGFAVGVKYTALPYVLGLLPIVIGTVAERERSFTGSFRPLMAFGLVFGAAVLPWLIKNWLIFGAPLYPHFVRPQVAPWLVPLFGSAAYPRNIDANLISYVWQLRGGFNILDGFFAPGNLTLESEGFLYFLNPALFILPLWLLFIKNRTLNRVLIPALVYPLIVLVGLTKPNLRYLIPAVAPLTIGVAYMMVRLSERVPAPAVGRRLLVALAFLALGPTIVASYLTLRSQAFPHLLGMSSANEYMASRIPRVYVNALDYANNELAPDSRILMFFEARGFYFEPRVIQDNGSKNWGLLSTTQAPANCLESMGITHVLLHAGALDWFVAQEGLGRGRLNWSAFEDFEARCLEPVYENPAFVLYLVRERPITDSSENP
jgi:hypothetical protein